MTSLALTLTLLVASGPDGCQDVYDRTARCEALDVDGLAVAPDPVAQAEAGDAEIDSFAWRLLAGSGVATVIGAALTGGVFAYEVHLASLYEAGTASTEQVQRIVFERSVVGWSAISAFAGAGLLLASAGAFFIFDPQRGTAREPFRIPAE
jgi:hypothetical protein